MTEGMEFEEVQQGNIWQFEKRNDRCPNRGKLYLGYRFYINIIVFIGPI